MENDNVKFKNQIKNNWFKLLIILLIGIFIAIYGYDVYKSHEPKSAADKILQKYGIPF